MGLYAKPMEGEERCFGRGFYPYVPQESWVSKTILDDVSLLLPCLDLWSRVYHSKNKFSPLVAYINGQNQFLQNAFFDGVKCL